MGRVETLQADLAALLKIIRVNTRNRSIAARIATVAAVPIGTKNRNPKAGIAGTNVATGGDPSYQRLYAHYPHCCGMVEKWYAADMAFRCEAVAPTTASARIVASSPAACGKVAAASARHS